MISSGLTSAIYFSIANTYVCELAVVPGDTLIPFPQTHFWTLQYRKVSSLANGELLYPNLCCGLKKDVRNNLESQFAEFRMFEAAAVSILLSLLIPCSFRGSARTFLRSHWRMQATRTGTRSLTRYCSLGMHHFNGRLLGLLGMFVLLCGPRICSALQGMGR